MKINERKIGVILSYISQFVSILSNLLYTPIMLKILGQSEYGLYQLVFSFVSYLGLLSFGFSSSYIRFYSRYKQNEQEESLAKMNGMFVSIFTFIAIVALICGIFMTINIELIFGEGLTEKEYEIAKILMMLMVINIALTFPNSIFDSITSAYEKFFFQKIIILLQNLLNPFLTLPLLLLGYGSIGMVAVTTLLILVKLGVNIIYIIKKLKVKFSFKQFDFCLLKEMGMFTFFIFINQIIDQINWSIDKFMLGRMVGTTAVAIYGLGAQINTMYLSFSTSISNVFIPKVNNIVAKNNDNMELTELFAKIGRIQFLVLSLILTGFIFFGQLFMKFWGGEGYEDSYYITLLLIIPVTVPLIQNLGIEIQQAKNMHKARSLVYLVIALANIFISYLLIKQFGCVGAACGTAISLFLGNILFMNWYYHKKMKLNMIYFWKEIFKFIPALIIPCVSGVLIKNFLLKESLYQMIMYVLIYIIIFIVSFYFFGMNEYEKELLNKPLRKIYHYVFRKRRY